MKLVIHHFPVTPKPTRHMVPTGSKIVSAAMREGKPVVYVERLADEPGRPQVLDARLDVFLVGTGHVFAATAAAHVATLRDGPHVLHVYGRIDHG
jgi:hypothetical protein